MSVNFCFVESVIIDNNTLSDDRQSYKIIRGCAAAIISFISLWKFTNNFKMKTILCLLVLSAVVAVQPALVNTSARANLYLGSILPGDRLLSRSYLYRPAVVNTIQSEDFVYRGSAATRISAIQAVEYGYTQFANIWVVNGGLARANVTLRAQSQRGRGYYYLIDIWGR